MEAYIVSDCGSRYPHEDGEWYQRNEVDAEIATLKAEVERLRDQIEKRDGLECYRFFLQQYETVYINGHAFHGGKTGANVSVFVKATEGE